MFKLFKNTLAELSGILGVNNVANMKAIAKFCTVTVTHQSFSLAKIPPFVDTIKRKNLKMRKLINIFVFIF
jgi:hypothetical protein